MKTLNDEATAIFCRLVDILNGRDHILLAHSGTKPLTIKKVTDFRLTPAGKVSLISLTQHKAVKSKFLRDPEIRFLVIDGTHNGNQSGVLIYPQFVAKDSHRLEREAIILNDIGEAIGCYDRLQADLCKIANQWLMLLKKEGFLK